MPTLTREQAREMDRIAMEEYGLPGIVLMENAARGIAGIALHLLDGASSVAILCGPGNNGGDGLAAARHLANAGIDVSVHLVMPPEAYREGSDPALNLAVVRAMGLALRDDVELGGAAVILDGIFGTGLSREIRGAPYRGAIQAVNEASGTVLAIDLPSGLDANTGLPLGAAVRADVTATMAAPKIGFELGQGPDLVGRVEVVDIGIPTAVIERVAS